MDKRQFLKTGASSLALGAFGSLAHAQATSPIKFQLDWRFEGPATLFLTTVAKGFFKNAGLDVTVDAGNGSGGTVTRVASGAYDMGFADLASVMEFIGNNPTAPNKPVAVMMVYNDAPSAVMTLKKSGIDTPAKMSGKKFGAPIFDAGRRAFPLFAAANKITNVSWTAMDPTLRETMLIRGDIDAITGFTFTSLLNLEARGVKASEVNVFQYPKYGVRLYGNAIIVSEKFLKEHPEEVRAFLKAFTLGVKYVIAHQQEAIAILKQRDGVVNTALEQKRLQMALQDTILTPSARAEGFGHVNLPRLTLMASQVSDVFKTKTRIDPSTIWSDAYLPSKAELDIFKK